MIVIFGATSDAGRLLAARLVEAGCSIRRVSRTSDGDVAADLATGMGLDQALQGADTVVSVAHARFTKTILQSLPPSVERLVLTGSAWRYSEIPNPRADQVRDAEAAFVGSRRDGVMLHPTMIYGGTHENNIRKLLAMIRKLPLIPAPDGGLHTVQPIFIDDFVRCLAAAVSMEWHGQHVAVVAGPPLRWCDMVCTCSAAIGCPRHLVSIPSAPIITLLSMAERLGLRTVDPNAIRRMGESLNIPASEVTTLFGVHPRDFESGIGDAMRNWRLNGLI